MSLDECPDEWTATAWIAHAKSLRRFAKRMDTVSPRHGRPYRMAAKGAETIASVLRLYNADTLIELSDFDDGPPEGA